MHGFYCRIPYFKTVKNGILHIGYIVILMLIAGCGNRSYTLTIRTLKPGGKTIEEVHKISADSDSNAYAQGATTYFLALHAYRMAMPNAKPYISKPIGFNLSDKSGRSVDSLLGHEKAIMIRDKTAMLVN